MKKRGFGPVGSLLLSIFAFVTFFGAHALAAAPYTCDWTGAGDGIHFSDPANWNLCNGAAPVVSDNDALLFGNYAVTNTNLVNDLTGASFCSLSFVATAGDSFDISGNDFTLQSCLAVSLTNDSTLPQFIDNNITMSGSDTVDLSGASLFLSGNLSGSGNIDKSGTQSLMLDGANSSYSGNITVSAGSIWASTNSALGNATGTTTINDGAQVVFDMGVSNSDLTIAEPITVTGQGDGQQFSNYALGAYSYADHILTLTGAITLTGDTQVAPWFKMNLTGALSGAHKITVGQGQPGKLVIQSSSNTSQTANGTYEAPKVTTTYSDSQPGTPLSIGYNETAVVTGTRQQVYVDKGGTLKGTGTISSNVDVANGGTIAPGMSPGCLSTGDLTIAGAFDAEIGGTVACTDYDQIKVTGTVDLTGGTLNASLYNSYKPKAGESYTIISNDGVDAVTGTFSGLAEGATFTLNGNVFKITYKGGDGNDVVLSVVSVPATPDTGFGTTGIHPFATLLATIISSLGLVLLARKYSKVISK